MTGAQRYHRPRVEQEGDTPPFLREDASDCEAGPAGQAFASTVKQLLTVSLPESTEKQ